MNYIQMLKTVVGVIVTILIAQFLHLDYAVSAGMITMLSILETKRQSFRVAFKRLVATLIGLLIAYILFNILGINLFVFGLIILVFLPIANKYGLTVAVISNTVLISHLFLSQDASLHSVLNEMYLLLLGMGMGLLLNIYIPSIEDDIKTQQLLIEELMKQVLNHFALNLQNQCGIDEEQIITNLKIEIDKGKQLSIKYLNNHLFTDHRYYLEYMEMREHQYYVLQSMNNNLKNVFEVEHIPLALSMATKEISDNISQNNDLTKMIEGLKNLKLSYEKQDLPQTRKEFEERAKLFVYYTELEELLIIKSRFLSDYHEIKYCMIS